MMRPLLRILAVLALAAATHAQRITPWNVEFHPSVIVRPISYQYRPAILLVFDPRIARPFLTMYPVGIAPQFVLRELAVRHPPGWQGLCGCCPTGVLLREPWFYGTLNYWPSSANVVEYWRGQALALPATGLFRIEYGTWTAGCWGAAPVAAAMVLEVQ